jgi:parallel beta-helix repeat protein
VPIIDRDFPPDRLGRDRKRSSKVIVLAVILIAVLMLGAVAGFMVQIANNREPRPSETPGRVPAGILYTTHSPISIIGNAGFTTTNGVSGGSGTASDPYIIADWDISASAADGIWIQFTDAHFIIRNCHVHDGSFSYDGIVLFECFNGTLENNNCSNDSHGILLWSFSNNNTLINNTCNSNFYDGIYLWSSCNNNTLINNTCSSNRDIGIYLYSSSDNTLINNNCSINQGGLYLHSSSNNMLSNNTCSSNSVAGVCLHSSSNNMLINNNCSSKNTEGIYLYLSSNNTLSDDKCRSNNYEGIYLDSSSNNTLINNNCSSNNLDGIFLFSFSSSSSSNNNEISGNLVYNNVGYGVNISSGSSNNRIWNNSFIGNNGATSTYDVSHAQANDDGTSNWWNGTDGYGNYWSDWTTPDAVPPWGIVDNPYLLDGSAGAKDNYPLTTPQTPIPEFGMLPLVVIALMAVVVLAGETGRLKKSRS